MDFVANADKHSCNSNARIIYAMGLCQKIDDAILKPCLETALKPKGFLSGEAFGQLWTGIEKLSNANGDWTQATKRMEVLKKYWTRRDKVHFLNYTKDSKNLNEASKKALENDINL